MFEFVYPWILVLLLLLPLLYWYMGYKQRRPTVIVSTATPFRKLQCRSNHDITTVLLMTAFLLLVVALARPRFGDEKIVVSSSGIDIILALDMSGSMSCFDLPEGENPQNMPELINKGLIKGRLIVAKEEIKRFVDSRPDDRIGLIGFADQAYNFSPPTLDHNWLVERLESLSAGDIGDATGIAAPIGAATSRLKNSTAKRRVLVLFTDGKNTAENRITPEQAAHVAKEFNVIIHTVGIGSGNAYAIYNHRLRKINDDFDEKLLKSLSQITGGRYFHAADANGFNRTMEDISKLEKIKIDHPKYIEFHEYAPLLSGLVLLCLLVAFLIENIWKLRIP